MRRGSEIRNESPEAWQANPLAELGYSQNGSKSFETENGVPIDIDHKFNQTGEGALETWTVMEGAIKIYEGPNLNGQDLKYENGHLIVTGIDKGRIKEIKKAA